MAINLQIRPDEISDILKRQILEFQREIDIWRAYSEFYSYEFFVMRVP